MMTHDCVMGMTHKTLLTPQNLAHPTKPCSPHKTSLTPQNLAHPTEPRSPHKTLLTPQNLANPTKICSPHKTSLTPQNLAHPTKPCFSDATMAHALGHQITSQSGASRQALSLEPPDEVLVWSLPTKKMRNVIASRMVAVSRRDLSPEVCLCENGLAFRCMSVCLCWIPRGRRPVGSWARRPWAQALDD